MFAVFGLLLAVLSAVFFASTLTTYLRWRAYQKDGAVCPGTVLSIEQRLVKSGKTKRAVFEPLVSYTFNGTEYRQTLKTGDLDARYTAGEPITLRCKTAAPEQVIIEDTTGAIQNVRKMLLVTLAMTVGGVLLFVFLR